MSPQTVILGSTMKSMNPVAKARVIDYIVVVYSWVNYEYTSIKETRDSRLAMYVDILLHIRTYLRFGDQRVVSVAQRTERQSQFTLFVALSEKFFEQPFRPLMVQIPSFGRMRNITAV